MLLSIIIPTKNRADYCLSALRSMRDITSEDVEILVVDNSTEDMSSSVAALGNPRIRYVYSPDAASVNENFNQAIAMARGRYLTLLGDDDGVHPGIVEIARKAEELDIDVLTTTRPAQYYWPDVKFRLFGRAFSGKLELRPFTGTLKAIDAKAALSECLKSGARVVGELPKAYYGLVRKTCLDELKHRTGAICRLSPDMSMSVGLVFTIRNMVRLDFPVFLPGTSGRSTAGLGAAGKHRGRLEDQPHLSDLDVAQWCVFNPRFFSGATVWAEACIRTLRAAGDEEKISDFSFPQVYARCLVFERYQWKEVVRVLRIYCESTNHSIFWIRLLVGTNYLREWLRRGAILLKNIGELTGIRPVCRFSAHSMEPAVSSLADRVKINHIKWTDLSPTRATEVQVDVL